MGKKNAKLYKSFRKAYQEHGDGEALGKARALLEAQQNISIGDRERLFGYLEGEGKVILTEPDALLTKAAKMPGLDGQKMSKSYNNTISLRETPKQISEKIRTMPTDTSRVRRNDPGDPAKCPVWQMHQVYSNEETLNWVQEGCRSAAIGCLDCKAPVIEAVLKELEPIRERAHAYEDDPEMVRILIAEGNDRARNAARETLDEVKQAMGLVYR